MKGKGLLRALLTGLVLSTLIFAGCDDGDDGDNGAPGASAYEIAVENGFVGTEQEWLDSLAAPAAVTAEPEQCAVCHSDVAGIHAATGIAIVVAENGALDGGGNFVVTFNLEVDGVASNAGYDLYRIYRSTDDPTLDDADPQPALTTLVRDQLVNRSDPTIALPAGYTVTSSADGVFVLTIPVADVVADAAYGIILRNVDASGLAWAEGTVRPGFVIANGTSPLRDLVSDDGESIGCARCHDDSASQLFDHYRVTGDECQICHARYSREADSYALVDGVWVNQGSTKGSNFTEYIHGIHNSKNMPTELYVRSLIDDPADGVVGDPDTSWSIGFPSDMRNCATCHESTDQLAAAVEAPVSFYLCMTCHQDWNGFVHGHDDTNEPPLYEAGDPIITGVLNFHRDYTVGTDCTVSGCHNVASRDEAGDFHNDFQGHDSHYDSYYRGKNISFENATDVSFQVDSVAVAADGALTVTWSASEGGVAVDPCNTAIATGPTFQDLSGYLAYAKGDDWVNEFVSSSPGQPAGRTSFFPDNTTCASNVATTTGLTLNPEAVEYASKVVLAIGGKAQTQYATGDTIYVRVPSPTYEFNLDGTVATARRGAVDNTKCLGCHQGTLYQHGGDRVDNEQLCVICHNPAASDKNNRLDRYQIVNADGTVNTDATYDGKNSETYDMRTMLHAIHGVEQRLETGGKPWVIYRGRGIYGFALEDTPLPAGWPADGGRDIAGSTNGSTQTHNWIVVHYPRASSECEACHFEGMYEAADQTKAVGVTVDPGFDYPDQSDDTLIGPSAAACTACHAGASIRSHAQANGYRANVTRDEMLEKAQ